MELKELPDYFQKMVRSKYSNDKEFSEAAGINRKTFSAMCTRGILPKLETFQRICKELELSADDLLGLTSKADNLTNDEQILLNIYRSTSLTPELKEKFKVIVKYMLEAFESGNVPQFQVSEKQIKEYEKNKIKGG